MTTPSSILAFIQSRATRTPLTSEKNGVTKKTGSGLSLSEILKPT